METLRVIGRSENLFERDVLNADREILSQLENARVLVVGAAGSIGQAVTTEIFSRGPRTLHAIDLSENNLVELVRGLRSTIGYRTDDFDTFAIDVCGKEFDAFVRAQASYDYVFNLSALKHVRSESDPYTLMRMIRVNVVGTLRAITAVSQHSDAKYFCVSTDKAANPVNMMGASKRVMELHLLSLNCTHKVSMARFANVAFSDGSLLHGFNQRFLKQQPLSAPTDVRRYFLTPKESGELCLLSGLVGGHNETFFPKATDGLPETTFAEIAVRFLEEKGFQPHICSSEEEARTNARQLIAQRKWPCYFFSSDTTGEKELEEFYTGAEQVDFSRFKAIGVINNSEVKSDNTLNDFLPKLDRLYHEDNWDKQDLVTLVEGVVDNFEHLETGKYLNGRM